MLTFKEYLGEDWRYRRPSLDRMLGITSTIQKVRKATGLNAIAKMTPNRIKQRVLQKIGIYGNNPVRTIRQTAKNQFKSPFKFMPKAGDD
jgi:hypothetical protein